MCTTCGCSDGAKATITDLVTGKTRAVGTRARVADGHLQHEHSHPDHSLHERFHHGHDHVHAEHSHDHPHSHQHLSEHDHGRDHDHDHDHSYSHKHGHNHAKPHAHAHGTLVSLEQEVLAKNNSLAERNRGWLEGRSTLALNLVSSPGAGKTTLLERTIKDLQDALPISVVEGDQETLFDAERIRATGCRSVQVNTGTGCHLDAEMLADALRELDPPLKSLVMIENVGNLVCPALFDLGENAKVVILSVTEGDDKPLKYPHMFRASSVMLLNKIDLLPHVSFDVAACISYARQVNPNIEVLQLSATTGEGTENWYRWLKTRIAGSPVEAVI